jgi:hypothetical protein
MWSIRKQIIQMPRVNRILMIAGLLSLCASYVGVWIQFINDPVQRTGSDFIAFYSAGRVAQEVGYSRVYDPLLQQAVQEKEVGFPLVRGQVLLYNHLPYLVPVLYSLVSEDYVASFYRWIVLLILLHLGAIVVLQKSARDTHTDPQSIRLTGFSAFLFLPMFFSLMNGQDTAILFLGAALWMYGLVTGREILAGLGLSLTTVRPHISLLLALPMLFKHRKAFVGYLIGSGILAVLSFMLLGASGTREYVDILLISAGGEWHGMKEEAMFNLIGLLTRGFPWLGAEVIRATGWIIYGMSILGLIFLWARNKEDRVHRIGLTVIIGLLTVPHLHFHDLTLLLIPVYGFITTGRLRGGIAAASPILISLLLLISNSSFYLQYSIPYLIMLAMVCYPYYVRKKTALKVPNR